ncbi:FAD-binding protein [Couchioplanes caeruleus]|uniref:Oxidoreductase n=2 Tax=Couchioplanes caeruleus TaxID=56438 RepID=A0A1K0FS31_9ACTN|nr:FAD-binding protein [Couchioplanes caeruleus]OJF15645.1 oxidoreductase [Couchioplanes caeruleus subsp. caeruleus]ROP33825.1 FAD/FMN-containing dehydrogenase [Couchioplanes caeruleus]
MISRRGLLGAAASAVAVVGFDPFGHRWVTGAEAATRPSFAGVPPLDGELAVDAAARQAVATDLGNIVHQQPQAVLRPASTGDVATMIRFCSAHGIPVSTRGQAHTTYGQGLSAGLVIEMRHLRRIHSLGARYAEVDAGILWKDLAIAANGHSPRLTPPVLTGYTGLTVGGTLSVGGIGGIVGGLRTGLQVDHVRELEVVTGTGSIERCSRQHKPDLFDAVLGGLGQCAVITRAVIELVPAPERARNFVLQYSVNAPFFRDLRLLIDRAGVDHVYAEFTAPDPAPVYKIHATAFYDAPAAPDDAAILAGLTAEAVVEDTPYLDYVLTIDRLIDMLRETENWDRLVKPWYDVWLPDSTIEQYLAELLPTLTARDIGPYGAGLIYPQRRDLATRPAPRRPGPDGSPFVYVVDINTVSSAPGADPQFAAEMLERNKRLYARAREKYGAVLYPIGSVPFTAQNWRDHYGSSWSAFHAAKRRYDPTGVLTPGPGIFSPRG